jgi:hypothetical protein
MAEPSRISFFLKLRLNAGRDGEECKAEGKAFHAGTNTFEEKNA